MLPGTILSMLHKLNHCNWAGVLKSCRPDLESTLKSLYKTATKMGPSFLSDQTSRCETFQNLWKERIIPRD